MILLLREHRTFIFALSLLQEIDLSLEICWKLSSWFHWQSLNPECGCLSNMNLEESHSSIPDAKTTSANHSLTSGGPVDPVVTSLRKETFQELNFDACGQGSNSYVSASFLFEILSSVTNRGSDQAVEVDGTCLHGLPPAGRKGWNGESTFSVVVVDEQMSNARSSALLSSSCFPPPPSLVSLITSVFQESQAVVAYDISRWRETANSSALITACPTRSNGSWNLSSKDVIATGLQLCLLVF